MGYPSSQGFDPSNGVIQQRASAGNERAVPGSSCACRRVVLRGARSRPEYPQRPMKVVLPDRSELELPDGATGLDAARAIGPKLAEQAVLVRANGSTRDLRLPLADGDAIQILTTRDAHDPDALYVLRHSTAHLLAEAVRRLYPGVKVAIGPPIENGFYYDFEFPEPIGDERPRGDRGRAPRGRSPRAASGRARRSPATRQGHASRPKASRTRSSSSTPPTGDISLYTQGDFTDLCRGPHLQNAAPIKAVKLTGLAGAYWRGDETEHAADPDLRHRLLLAGRSRRAPRATRAGAHARPPPPRAAARPLPPAGSLARLAVLAPEGDGALERARGSAPAREPRGAATSR